MGIKTLLKSLKQSLDKNDISSVRKLLLENSELLAPTHECQGIKKCDELMTEMCNHNNRKIIELFDEFPEFLRVKNMDLKKYLNRAMFRGNMRLCQIFLTICEESSKKVPKSMLFEHSSGSQQLQNVLLQFIGLLNKHDGDAVKIAEILINSGASVNETDRGRCSPLIGAIVKRNISVISLLLERGAKVNSKNLDVINPLKMAVVIEDKHIINLILSFGGDINDKDVGGLTALHSACLVGDCRMADYLVKRGASISITNNDGETPFSLLQLEKDYYYECVRLMVKEFSKLKFKNEPITETDMKLIQSNPKARKHFENCTAELELMACTKFYAYHSLYSVMSVGTQKLANLAKNQELVSKFEASLMQLCYFKSDLQTLWDEAIKKRDSLLIIESRLNSVFSNFLPEIVKRKLAKQLNLEDLPVD